jgi:16S rRNA (guanine527-N7)-methyltransferase
VFTSGRLALAERYAAWLADDGGVRGLIGPREAPRLWDRHLLNCAVLGEAVPADARVVDLGSGAGLPGLVLAIARPDVHVTLVEPLLRRTTFLEEVCADLEPQGLENVTVVRGRAEALHGEQTFDVVTARALAPLERLLGWGMPLVAPHGALVAMKGSSAPDEIEAAAPVLHRLRCAPPEVLSLGGDLLDQPTRVVRVVWAEPAEVGWRSDRDAGGRSVRSGSSAGRKRRR